MAASGVPLRYSLPHGIEMCSPHCFTIMVDGTPAVITGVSDLGGGSGAVWALGTDDIERYPRQWHVHSQKVLRGFHRSYPRLTNVVDTRNTTHILWLRRLGFRFTKLHPYWGPFGLPFLEFERTITNV